MTPIYDVIIVGGGPAGLNAAMFLGRCCRNVILFDDGQPRNWASDHLHGFLTRDGISPNELRQLGIQELTQYGVEMVRMRVACARQIEGENGFEVATENGQTYRGKKILLATGFHDRLPEKRGAKEYYGHGLYHCPYCDAFEYRHKKIAALGSGHDTVGLALSLSTWSDRVYALTDGYSLDLDDRRELEAFQIEWFEDSVSAFLGKEDDNEKLGFVEFESGRRLECEAVFFQTERLLQSPLALQLGCEFVNEIEVKTERTQNTRKPGVFLAGDADGDVQFAIVAASEGACAAVAINRELQNEEREERLRNYEKM